MTGAMRPDSVPGLQNFDPKAPVYMVNLLKFKTPNGVASYLEYGAGVAPLLEAAGASVCFTGSRPRGAADDSDSAWWDVIIVVKYPTPGAFLDMVTSESYQQIAKHRDDALERGDLIATADWDFTQPGSTASDH